MRYTIKGGKPACGEVKVSGAKNFSIKAFAASLLTKEKVEYTNIPENSDIYNTAVMLESAGVAILWQKEKKSCVIDASSIQGLIANFEQTNMATHLMGAAMLHRFDTVKFPKAKGCQLGKRGDDFHIQAFKQFGAEVHDTGEGYIMHKKERLKGTHINLPYPSVGATETGIFLGVLASGITHITNAAVEPEVQALITMLTTMGANIIWEDDRTICIYGTNYLGGGKVDIHSDLLETATWAVLAAATGGDITVSGVIPEWIGSFLGYYSMLGGGVKREGADKMRFFRKNNNAFDAPLIIETGVYPKFRTDLQPIIAVMAALSRNSTIIHETVFNDRLDYAEDFKAFGIDVEVLYDCLGNKCRFDHKYIHNAIIKGGKIKAPKDPLEAKTIRSGMALMIMAAIAEGSTVITSADRIERGYCSIVDKLKSLGVDIERKEIPKIGN